MTSDTLTHEQKQQIMANQSLIEKAMGGDESAIREMFQSFMPEDETFKVVKYLGVKGWGSFGRKSFGCVTNRRVARLEFGFFDELIYQDALIRDINSVIYYQPSRLPLYLLVILALILAIPSIGISLISLLFIHHIYYRLVKSGVVFAVREGISVYIFANRARLEQVKRILDELTRVRTSLVGS